MAVDDSRSRYQALVVPDERIAVWRAETTVDATGGHVGQPVAASTNTGRMALRSLRRTRPADTDAIEIRTTRGGFPAPTSASSAAEFRWKYEGESDDLLRGRDTAFIITGWTPLAIEGDVDSGTTYEYPDIVTTPLGAAMVAYVRVTDGIQKEILVRRLLDNVWGDPIVVADGLDVAEDWVPKLLVKADVGQIDLHYGSRIAITVDDGLTWSTAAIDAEGVGAAGTAMAYRRGQVLRFTAAGDQYASNDGGYSWSLIEETALGYAALVATDDGFMIHGVRDATTITITLGDAYDGIGGAGTGTGYLAAGARLVLSDDGTPHRALWGAQVWDGSAWVGEDGDHWFGSAVRPDPRNISACWHNGRVLIAHSWAGTDPDSVAVASFGGWTNGPAYGGLRFTYPWLPSEPPEDLTPWNISEVTITSTVRGGALQIPTVGTDGSSTWTFSDTLHTFGETHGGIRGRFVVKTTADLASAPGYAQTNKVVVRITDTYVWTYELRITTSSDTIYVYERDGAASWSLLGSVAADCTQYVDVAWALHDGVARAFWRYADDPLEDRVWAEICNGAVTNIIAHDDTEVLSWGSVVDGGTCRWREFHFNVALSATDPGGAVDFLGTDPPFNYDAATFAARGSYVADRAVITADGGPVAPHDSWLISTDHDNRVEHILDDRPRLPWVGLPDGTAQHLAFKIDEDNAHTGTDLWAIPLFNSTISRVTVSTYDADEAEWVEEEDYTDIVVGVGAWRRHGHTIVANGNSADLLVRMSEFDGCHFSPGPGTHAAGLPAVKIVKTHEGMWTTGNTKPAVLELDANADLSAWPTTGTIGAIIPLNAVILFTFRGAQRAGIRLTLDSTGDYFKPPATGWQIGSSPMGQVLIHPEDQAWGRAWEVEDGTKLTEVRDRTRRARVEAPTRRIFEVSWADGVDTLGASEDTADPAFHTIEISDSDPVALSRTTPWQVQGIAERVEGSRRVLTYLPRVERFDGSPYTQVINRRHLLAGVRLLNTARFEVAQGDEGIDEVIRISTLTLSEEV